MSIPNNQSPDIIKTDIAIIGGGSAGLTLASKLKHQPTVVVEPKTPDERDVCWALWAKSHQQKELIAATKGQWNQWRLIDHHREVLHTSNQYNYLCLSSADYLRNCESQLSSNTQLVRDYAEDIQSYGRGGIFSFEKSIMHNIYMIQDQPNLIKMVFNSIF